MALYQVKEFCNISQRRTNVTMFHCSSVPSYLFKRWMKQLWINQIRWKSHFASSTLLHCIEAYSPFTQLSGAHFNASFFPVHETNQAKKVVFNKHLIDLFDTCFFIYLVEKRQRLCGLFQCCLKVNILRYYNTNPSIYLTMLQVSCFQSFVFLYLIRSQGIPLSDRNMYLNARHPER